MAEQMIYKLIGQAMARIGAIGKNSVATNFNGKTMYIFRGIDAVYNALNPVMSELGIFIIPEIVDQFREERKSTNGANLIYSIMTVKFTMYAPDGSSISGTTVGEGMDSGDKASNKAMSAALKYFCFQTFMIPTEEMKDADSEVHETLPGKESPKAPSRVKNDNPVQVTKQEKLPDAKPENPVVKYLNNERAFMAQKMGLTAMQMKIRFQEMRKSVVSKGIVPDIAADKLTMQQAKELIEAIYANCLNAGDVPA